MILFLFEVVSCKWSPQKHSKELYYARRLFVSGLDQCYVFHKGHKTC
jgi:hypothetical protein